MKLSVIIITKNEALNIGACIESVLFASELLIVDSGSTDCTCAIARQAGATVIETTEWPGFGPQKNCALDAASGEWILSIDADERITPALRDEIIATIEHADHTAYMVPRLSSFYGSFIRHSGWYPDHILRLFRRSAGRFSSDLVHEKIILNVQSYGYLHHPIVHYSYRDDDAYLRKLQQYSSLGAEQAYQAGKRCGLASAIVHALTAFTKSYLFKFGFLDGRAGLMVAICSAESSYHKYLKLMLLSNPVSRDKY